MNYGPDPSAAVRYVRQHAAMVVRGNHDNAVAFGEDPRCSARFRQMAEETCRYTRSVLAEDDLRYLRALPLKAGCEVGGVQFLLCHAAPSNPLFEYRAADSGRWSDDPAEWSGVVITGHTHLPFQRAYAGKIVPAVSASQRTAARRLAMRFGRMAASRSARPPTTWRRLLRNCAPFRCRPLSSTISHSSSETGVPRRRYPILQADPATPCKAR